MIYHRQIKSNKSAINVLIDHFNALTEKFGFITAAPTKLLSDDTTLLFANSTIAGYKQHLLDGRVPCPGLSIVQECIRNHNLKKIRVWNEDLEYMSCFTQFGVLGCPKSLPMILEFITHYFMDISSQQHLLCRVSLSQPLYQSILHHSDFWQIEADGRPPSYYSWQYGLGNVTGEGVTFAIRDERYGLYRDIGNLIEIRDATGVLGYEFGFGAETLDSRLRGFESPFESSLIYQCLDFYAEPSLKRKTLDSLMLAATLCSIGVDESTLKYSSILRHAMNDLVYLSYLCNLDSTLVLSAGKRYLKIKNVSDINFVHIFDVFQRRISQKINLAQRYIDYARTHEKNWQYVRRYCIEKQGIPAAYFESIFGSSQHH